MVVVVGVCVWGGRGGGGGVKSVSERGGKKKE